MFSALMRNGVLFSEFQHLMEERLSMEKFNFTSSKAEDIKCYKVMLVLLVKPIFITKVINLIFSALFKEKLVKKTQQFILLKFLPHHKVSKNSKRTHQLTMILNSQLTSQLLFKFLRNTVQFSLLQNSVLFTYMKLVHANKSTKQEFQLELFLQYAKTMLMMDSWLLLKQDHSMLDLLMKINLLITC